MSLTHILLISLIGVLAGLCSGLLAKRRGRGFRLFVHVLVGVIGAFHGRLLLGYVGLAATSASGHLIFAGVGALLFLYPLKFIRPT
jgi:uncharacterized membrane protein YeaQ/YmgE (transglycosylase-associated protein family)